MAYRLIAGEIHIHYPDRPRQGPQPDGDTVRFRPDQPALLDTLTRTAGVGPAFNARGLVSLRLEAIDALELHYEGTNQELAGAVAARSALLEQLGFGAVTFFADDPYTVQSVEHHPRRGYILTRSVDRYGRVISFLFAGDPPETDGALIHLPPPRLDDSLNGRLLRGGSVYPAFYTSLPVDLRLHLAAEAGAAQASGAGIWARDLSVPPRQAEVNDAASLEALAIWPKLFRRLVPYFSSGFTGLASFESWLRDDRVNRDDEIILPNLERGNLHDVLAIAGNSIGLTLAPQDIVIVDSTGGLPPPPPVQPSIRERDVRIVAALANPLAGDAGAESITLLNTSPGAIDLTGWHITDFAAARLSLGGALPAGDARRIPLSGRLRLNNTGDTVTLLSPDGTQVDQVTYSRRDATREGWTIVF